MTEKALAAGSSRPPPEKKIPGSKPPGYKVFRPFYIMYSAVAKT
jgi:hypothetical protein